MKEKGHFGRGSAAERGYGARWQKARATFLGANPLCRMCLEVGRTEPATVVDHIEPHRGDSKLFWDRSNWQPLCAECHDSHKKRIEKSGLVVGCNVDGMPLDQSHPWNQNNGRT